MIGVYRAGNSLLHRTPAGAKLLALLVFTTLLLIFRSPTTMGVGLIVVILAYALATYTPVVMVQQIWPMKWIVIHRTLGNRWSTDRGGHLFCTSRVGTTAC